MVNSWSKRARNSQRLALITTSGLLMCGAAGLAQAQSSPSTGIEQVIVTSQRRATVIRKVPVSVTAISGATLAKKHIVTIQDVLTLTPNVSFASTYQEAHIFVRGAGENLTDLGSESAVPIHLDDVYIARPEFGFSDLLDVQRVEVLRGPQGTLFGHNATGGVVNIIPNLPTPNFDAGASFTAGGGPTILGTQDFINGKLNDSGTLFGRIAVQDNYNQGFFKNLNPTGPRYLSNENAQGGRAQLEWQPSDIFSTRLSLDASHSKDNGPDLAYAGMPPGSPDGSSDLAAGAGGVLGNPKNWTAEANQGLSKVFFTSEALHSELKLGSGTLKLIDSATQSRDSFDGDQDGTSLNFADLAFNDHASQIFNEALYQSDQNQRWRYQLGGVEFYEKASQQVIAHTLLLPAFLNPIALGGAVNTDSYAGFGHTEFDVTQQFHLFGGARWTYDHKTDDEYNVFIAPSFKQQHSWRSPTYQVGGRYDVTDDINVYATYSTGYKGGGYNTGSLTPAFNPETDRTVEVGAKAGLLDNRLSINASAFTNNYSNLQVNQVSTYSSLVTNAGAARIRGLELEIAARPIPDLRLELTGSYLDARFVTYSTEDASRPTLGVLNLAGNYLPNAPPYSLSTGAYYTIHLPEERTLEVGGRVYGQGETYFSPFNLKGDAQNPVFRGDITGLYTIDQHWTVNVFARNVTNALVRNYGQALANVVGGAFIVNYDPGRTVGVTVAWRY